MADRRVSSRIVVVVHPSRHDGPEFLRRLGIEKQGPVLGLETAHPLSIFIVVSCHQHLGKPLTPGRGTYEVVRNPDGSELAAGLTLPAVGTPILVE